MKAKKLKLTNTGTEPVRVVHSKAPHSGFTLDCKDDMECVAVRYIFGKLYVTGTAHIEFTIDNPTSISIETV